MRLRQIAKESVYGLLAASGMPNRLGRHRGTGLTILTYHSIGPAEEYPYLNRIPPSRFAAQIHYLAQRYDVISLEEGLARLESGKTSRAMVAVTIDDGYADNFEYAWPVLREVGVPATIFVATDYLDTGRLPWPTQISALLHYATAEALLLPEVARFPARLPLKSKQDRAIAGDVLRMALSCMDQPDRDATLTQMAEALAPRDMAVTPPLQWDQMRKMREAGICFGAHTRYHAWLDKVSPTELTRELRDAKLRIEAELDQPCEGIAYPNGNHNAAVRAAAATAGYRFGLTQERGVNRAGTDPMALHRVQIPFDERLGSFICRTAGFTIR